LKYALLGQVNETAQRIAEISREWLAAIAGQGEIDLRGTAINAPCQYLLVPSTLFGNLAGAMGHMVFGDHIRNVPESEWPDAARQMGFRGQMVAMHEPGIDVASVIQQFQKLLAGCCYHYDPHNVSLMRTPDGGVAEFHVGDLVIAPRQILCAAARGNQWLAGLLGIQAQCQTRPLKMVFAKGDLPNAYWHAVGASPKPIFTISSHRAAAGEAVWYIGGGVAEDGVGQTDAALFAATQKAIKKFLPKLNLDGLQWASLPIDRIEGLDPRGHLPERPSYQRIGNVTLGWVNKLTFAPLMAREVLADLQPQAGAVTGAPLSLPPAVIAQNPWDKVTWTQH
jgi:hypothetical protein